MDDTEDLLDAITVTYWTREWTTPWTDDTYTARYDSRHAAAHGHEDVPGDILFADEVHEVTTTYRVGDEVTVYGGTHPQRGRVVALLSPSHVLVGFADDRGGAQILNARSVPISMVSAGWEG